MFKKQKEKIKEYFLKNPILYVFTTEYKKELITLDNAKRMLPYIKLKSNDYDIDKVLEPLIKKNYKSNFSIEAGNFL